MAPVLIIKILALVGFVVSWVLSLISDKYERKVKEKEDAEFINKIADTVVNKMSANK